MLETNDDVATDTTAKKKKTILFGLEIAPSRTLFLRINISLIYQRESNKHNFNTDNIG